MIQQGTFNKIYEDYQYPEDYINSKIKPNIKKKR